MIISRGDVEVAADSSWLVTFRFFFGGGEVIRMQENKLVQAESCFEMALVLKLVQFNPWTVCVLLGVAFLLFLFRSPGAYGFVMVEAFVFGVDACIYSLKTVAGRFMFCYCCAGGWGIIG